MTSQFSEQNNDTIFQEAISALRRGDKARAKELLTKALAINPQGIDANYFYAEYLIETKQADEAAPYLERVLQAPPRPGRQIADAGRREEARALLAKIKSP